MFFFVLVLYKCKLSDSVSFISISNSLKENGIKADILIWDNSPEPQKLSSVDKEVWDFVKYRHCPENDGVSKAYNAGAVIANNLDRKWLILLDQDTEFNVDIIKKLYEIISFNLSSKILFRSNASLTCNRFETIEFSFLIESNLLRFSFDSNGTSF